MDVFNINDVYFKYQKCLSGITYQYVNQLDNIYDMNLMVGTNYCIYCMYNEFDIINNFMVNLNQVDICCTTNIDLTQKYYQLDGVYLKTNHKVLLVSQIDTRQNDVYTVDPRGYLNLTDDLADTGVTWRYKAYVKLGNNKGKQFHLKNIGNRFPIGGHIGIEEKKEFLDGHGYIVKNLFNYNLFDTSIVPGLIFTDYQAARISVNRNADLYIGFSGRTISEGGYVNIKYHENTPSYYYDTSGHTYTIKATGDTSKFIYLGTTGVQGCTESECNIFNHSGSTDINTYIKTNSTICSSAKINDYIKLSITGSTSEMANVEIKSFIVEIEPPGYPNYIVIKDHIQDYILNDYHTGTTESNYSFTNLMYSIPDTFERGYVGETMMESYYAKYFNINYIYASAGSAPTRPWHYVYPVDYNDNMYFDYDGLTFEFEPND